MLLQAEPFVSGEILKLKEEVRNFKYVIPRLVVIKVGNNAASETYIRNKVRMCEAVGIKCSVWELSEKADEYYITELIEQANSDKRIHGIIVQLPLPEHLNEREILDSICPYKDVDGLGSYQNGLLQTNHPDKLISCTPLGIINLLKYYNIQISGKHVVIVNRSNIVGKPLTTLFLQEDATVTVCHSKTDDLIGHIQLADIVVTAIGKANFFNYYDFRPDTTIVDVSMNRDENGRLCGDVDKSSYEALLSKGCNIVPVPGGVGRTTVLSLIKNVVEAYKRS